MAPSSTHDRKRQYQPSNQTTLTSYFDRNSDNARSSSPMSPPLPPYVQSGLLSVGMRVRKSVPEGYKTEDKTFSSPFSPTSSAPAQRPSPSGHTFGRSNTRELMPFCGLHKTGGWAAQEMPVSSAPAALGGGWRDEEEDMPGLTMSQSSMRSSRHEGPSMSQHWNNDKKRSYEDDAEEDMDAFFDESEADAAALTQHYNTTRPLARMKASVTTRKPGTLSDVRILNGDDFEEATFLVPMDVDYDGES